MVVIEAVVNGGFSSKTECDLCMEEPENGVLIEKPNSMIVNGQVFLAHRPKPLHICLDCLTMEIENMQCRNTKTQERMMKLSKVSIDNAQVNLLLEVDGKIHLVGMDKDKLNTVEFFIKNSVDTIIPTKKTQQDLLEFLDYKR